MRQIMRNLRWLLMLLAVSGMSSTILRDLTVVAAEPAEDGVDIEREVRRLVDDLSGETRAQRTAAEKRLVELGPKVLPHLPPPELLPSISVREAVRKIRFELERVQARESVLPSRVTLDGGKSLREVFEEITRQTTNPLEVNPLPDALLARHVDLDFNSVPFWQVLDDLGAQFDLRFDYDSSFRGLKLLPGPATRPSGEARPGYSGAFRIQALAAERISVAGARPRPNLRPRAAGELVRVTLLVAAEPRLRPLFLQYAARDITARTAAKTSLAPFSPDADYELALGEGGGQARLQLDYVIPESDKSASLDVKGKLRCTTAAGNEMIRFSDLAKAAEARGAGVARRRGGVTVTLNRLRLKATSPGKQEARVQVAVTYDTGGLAFESHRTWILHNEVFLEDPAGKRVRLNGGSETTRQSDGAVGIEYRFVDLPDPLPDYTFVYVAPTLIVDVPIEFEIQSAPISARKP